MFDYLCETAMFGEAQRQGSATVRQPGRPTGSSQVDSDDETVPAYQFKPRALIVDDSADIAFMMVMILQHAGYEAVMAISAVEALALAQREHFDLIISDIGMPQMDGYVFAERLRALPDYATTPMIAVTGFAEYDDRDRALSAGFNTHLKKPVDVVKLLELIEGLRL
jgi:two-component system, chemotaxis family, CheB/CheR fusion protein